MSRRDKSPEVIEEIILGKIARIMDHPHKIKNDIELVSEVITFMKSLTYSEFKGLKSAQARKE